MLNKLFKNRYFLPAVQFFTLTVFVLLIYSAIGITTKDPAFAKILRNTNLPNLIVWSYWWPLIIVTAILFGRFWCTICPMELVTSFAGKIGLRRKPGKFLKSGWVITLFYAIILIIGIHTLAIHRIPKFMAIYMLVLFFIALVSGLIWEKRTFCSHICPIGHLLGLYSMLSIKKLRVLDVNICNDCKTKDCISKSNHYKFSGRSCTSELYPAQISDNRTCILCGQCHKSCTKDNIAIQTQKLAADLFTNIKLTWAEIGFFMMVSGFIIYEVLTEWKVSEKIVMAVPNWIIHFLNITAPFSGTAKAIILFIIFPSIFFTFFAFLKKTADNGNWKEAFSQITIALLPIAGSMHLLKALLKATSRIPYWNYTFSDPNGIVTAHMLMDKTLFLNKGILSALFPYLSIAALLLSVGGLILSFLVINKQQNQSNLSKLLSLIAVLIYAGLFLSTFITWRIF